MNEATLKKARILVVDDNVGIVRLLATLFEEKGIHVDTATSVREARQQLLNARGNYDLVLSDISMPGESGFDLLRWMKGYDSPNPDVPVLLTTAQMPEPENRVLGLSLGAVDYVVRPIEMEELVIRVLHAMADFQRVKSLKANLENSEKMAMVGRILAAFNHEIKNLSAIVKLSADQVHDNLLDGPMAELSKDESLQILRQSSDLLAQVTRDLGGIITGDKPRLGPVDLVEVATMIGRIMGTRVRPSRLFFELPPTPIWVLANDLQVKQILINLILNAADAIHEIHDDGGVPQGNIIVSIQSHQPESWTIHVRDNGIGFKDAGERREFEAFRTTKQLRGGQGLGLWLCSKLAHDMGGSLVLRSDGPLKGVEAGLTLKSSNPPVQEAVFDISSYLTD